MSQHRATLRRSLQSALKHRKLADSLLDSLSELQTKFNLAMDKLDADDEADLDTDYAATASVALLLDADAVGTAGQHRASLRKTLQSSLSHRRLANSILDSMTDMQSNMNALLVKLDAEAGTLAGTDYEATLAVEVTDADVAGHGQHKASMRRSLESALSHRRLANQIADSIEGMEKALNAALAQIDTGAITGVMAALKVSVVVPDAE